jgi:hypothetical protein
MFEPRTHRLLSWPRFLRRAARHLVLGVLIVAAALSIGVIGYHVLGGLGWVDAFLNASMILGGMGPVDRMESDGAKVFAACYALFSGLVLIAVMGVVLAPWLHRMLHLFHVDTR